jgi:hypothetical protein
MFSTVVRARQASVLQDLQEERTRVMDHACVNGIDSCAARTSMRPINKPGDWLNGAFDDDLFFAGCMTTTVCWVVCTITLLLPFRSFAMPECLDGSSELADTALCFHINQFNQGRWNLAFRVCLVLVLIIGFGVISAYYEVGVDIWFAAAGPFASALISLWFIFPYTEYNNMTYNEFARDFLADGQNALADELTLVQIFSQLLLENSSVRVLEAVSRQAQVDGRRTKQQSTERPRVVTAKVSPLHDTVVPLPASGYEQ